MYIGMKNFFPFKPKSQQPFRPLGRNCNNFQAKAEHHPATELNGVGR